MTGSISLRLSSRLWSLLLASVQRGTVCLITSSSVNLQFAKLERRIYGPYGSEMKMRKRILRVHVHRATLGIYISRNRRTIIIGASLSEPHINGTAVRELYIILYYYYYYYYGTSVTRNICPVWLYGYKREIFYCAFSCLGYAPYIRRSNLVNCKFTLVPACSKARGGANASRDPDFCPYTCPYIGVLPISMNIYPSNGA